VPGRLRRSSSRQARASGAWNPPTQNRRRLASLNLNAESSGAGAAALQHDPSIFSLPRSRWLATASARVARMAGWLQGKVTGRRLRIMRLFGCARVAGLAGQPAGEPAAPAPPLSHRDSRAQQEQCVQPAGTVRQPSQRFSSQPNRTAAIGALTQLVGLEQLSLHRPF